MPIDFMNHRGEPLIPAGDSPSFKFAPRPKREPEPYFKGWSVQGHPPGALEKAKAHADKEWARWQEMSEAGRAEKLKEGHRAPLPWSEPHWRETTRPTRVRPKPYEVPSAAEECKRMAERSGWLDVRLVEIRRQ